MPVQTATLSNGQTVKLGRIRPKSRPTALRFAAYFDENLATTAPPVTVDNTVKAMAAISQMYGNNQYGDCVIAGKMHSVGVVTGNETGTPAVGTTDEAVNQYHQICGGGDNGCNITDVLDFMKSNGLVVGGTTHKIDGYVAVNWTNKLQAQVALYLFGTLTIGIGLPSAWESSDIWDVTSSPIIGGHDVTIAGYDSQYVSVLTWGSIRKMTWAAFLSKDYLDECYAPLYQDWYSNSNMNPMGFDVATLQADLVKIGQGSIPPIDPVGPPWAWNGFS